MNEGNAELKDLYRADIAQREGPVHPSEKDLSENDQKRRKRVREIIENIGLATASDYHHAALIFQHGDSPDDYKLANDLATKAMEMGEEKAKWLYAATLDRWLLSTGQPQKFGTQFRQDKNDQWQLEPTDSQTTDVQRAKYNVPPIARALKPRSLVK